MVLGLAISTAWATHNRAGEITYTQSTTNPLEFVVTVTTYTRTSSTGADRDTLTIYWGDGKSDKIERINGPFIGGFRKGEAQANDVKFNQYQGKHTFPGRFTYTVSINDPNRAANILNVNAPASDNVRFYLQTTIVILNAQFQGTNNSPVLLQSPIDIGYVGQVFTHNPNAFDIEGDSVAYELIEPLSDVNTPVPRYVYPNLIIPGPNNQISLNEVTGDFVWNSPQKKGQYNIAFMVKEYRNGNLISAIVRDMQITIDDQQNRPPKVTTKNEYCIVAGDVLQFNVVGTDPDPGQRVKLTATGGPLQQDANLNPIAATFTKPPGYRFPPVTGVFRWQTSCENIREQYYQMVFRAVDNFEINTPDTLGSADLKSVRIHVIAPPPLGLTATQNPTTVELNWQKPYKCEGISQNRFKGFNVWRKVGCTPINLDTCGMDLAALGYVKIASRIKTFNNITNTYNYIDNLALQGTPYSYRVTAEFTEVNSSGFPFNIVQSLPSDQVCAQLPRILPLMTTVDVAATSTTAGQMNVKWSRANREKLDTITNPGPYRYALFRAPNFAGGAPVRIYTSPLRAQFWQAVDTTFLDTNLNTTDQPYHYQVAFFVRGNDSIGVSSNASSVYLNIASTDKENKLTWNEVVPWTNTRYIIERKNTVTTAWDSIGQSTTRSYNDVNLINAKQYCYRVKSVGNYFSTPFVASPLLNYSQERCGTPIDTVPPCPPILTVDSDCGKLGDGAAATQFKNTLNWTLQALPCSSDIEKYNVYYAEKQNGTFVKIATVDSRNIRQFIHENLQSVAGCYAITAIDSLEVAGGGGGNEGRKSNIVCVDNCPIYELPNVFTPNGDNLNDAYTPIIPYRFVSKVDMKIFNVWGGLVFQTTDPNLNWDGRDLAGKTVAEAVYYYTCEVFELRLGGEVKREKPLSGYIQLIRGK